MRRPNSQAQCFERIAQEELKDIGFRRKGRGDGAIADAPTWRKQADQAKLFGICLSGGGIRSATFALGVLQGLTEKGLLQRADYLSTVSGGGYIGSWLQGCLDRAQKSAAANPTATPPDPFDILDPRKPEHPHLHFLRKYSNYLAPRPGLSLDTVAIPVIWARNAGLNQIILVASAAAAIMTCLGASVLPEAFPGARTGYWLALALAVLAVFAIARNLRDVVRAEFQRGEYDNKSDTSDTIGYWVVMPILMAAWALTRSIVVSFPATIDKVLPLLVAMVLLHAAFQYWGGFLRCYRERHKTDLLWKRDAVLNVIWISVVCGALDCGLLFAVAKLIHSQSVTGTEAVYQTNAWAPPLVLLAIIVATALQIGLMGADYPDSAREWLARAGSWILICGIAWAAVFTLAAFAPYWIILLWASKHAAAAALVSSWVGSTTGGILAGKSSKTADQESAKQSNDKKKISLDVLARYAPIVALPGFFVAVSFGLHAALYAVYLSLVKKNGLDWSYFVNHMQGDYWEVLKLNSWWYAALFGAAVAIFFVLSVRVNINEFSMHHFYKNRLVRCYLGASADADINGNSKSTRSPNRFTGFDPKDDLSLDSLRVERERKYTAPYPILNATLTVTQGTELATQERKAKPWIFTPRYSGFVPEDTAADREEIGKASAFGYAPTKEMLGGGLHLGTAMAISGAALNPGQGYHSSTQVAFLMTLFDARLGWWIGNPRSNRWRRPGPMIALWPLIRELFGSLNERSLYLNLSDGGNFENLGLYELVRRRCRYIIAIDAEEDPKFGFSALGGAVRKCRIDFGTEIKIAPGMIRPNGEFSAAHCAVGEIQYRDSNEPGYLLYIKASVTGDEPEDVEQYRRDLPVFPQQPTLDQFFTESQFESYRCLGLHCARSALDPVLGADGCKKNESLDIIFGSLAVQWPVTVPTGGQAKEQKQSAS
jgi:hypothetical protein